MRQLEEQVKIIPVLELQLAALRAEKEQLVARVKEEKLRNINFINNNVCSRSRSRSVTQTDDNSGARGKSSSPAPARRDFGVMCGVLTRNVGVGPQTPKTKTVSTGTCPDSGDKWLPHKLDFLIGGDAKQQQTKSPLTVGRATQTTIFKYEDVRTQTNTSVLSDNSSQTPTLPKSNSIGVSVHPRTSVVGTQSRIECTDVGVSDDNINSILCLKCTSQKQTVGVNTDALAYLSVSLAQLSRPKIETEDDVIERRSIGCQYDIGGSNKYTQYEIKSHSRTCQSDPLQVTHRGIQSEIWSGISKSTDTKELLPKTEERGCNSDIHETVDVACETVKVTEICEKCNEKEKTEETKKEEIVTPSKIPRLNNPQRKFERQITYTKTIG